LLCGIALTSPTAKEVEAAARTAGFLVNAAAPDVVRLAPALIITDHQLGTFVTALPGILDTVEGAE
jgi:acetylornithine/N-succinyldiaminopimelate aminotransferase